MPERYYEHIPVTDALAAERTVLSAERTFLAYLRTSFAMFITGLTGSQLLRRESLVVTGYVLTAASVGVLIVGAIRYRASRRRVRHLIARLVATQR
ncbi:MAG: DUF202 domain-containing protein [Myxococcales bacterium]|nr:DUF202 domain-containing protein [Myxococcales bacterium]